MRSFLFTLIVVFSFGVSKAGNLASNESLCQKLSLVNAEWSKQPECTQIIQTAEIPANHNFNDWIATHLMLVEKTLGARNTQHLSPAQKQNRFRLLDELNRYWKAGSFPVNDYLTYKNPVFIDRKGTHCAVGYLMMQSGSDALAQKINSNEKFAYVHEIKTAGIKEWADENGFTVDELAWIQPGYPPTTVCFDLDSGLNGTVNTIAPDSSGQVVYVAGSFTQSISGVTCNHVAAWISGFAGWDWIPVGSGLNGTVHTLLLRNNKLYAGGEFTMAGATAVNHVAVYDISLGQWQAIGSLDSTVRALTFYNGELYAGGNFTGFVSKWSGSQWQNVTNGFLYGEGVRTLEVWDTLLVIGGSFELATGALRRHVATYNGTYMGALGFGTKTPVNDLEIFNGKLIAACDVIIGNDTCAIAEYDNMDWQVRLKNVGGISSYFQGNSVKALLLANNRLFAAGDYACGGGMTYGTNLSELSEMPLGWGDSTQFLCMPLVITDTSVKAIAAINNTLYFGGMFTTGLSGAKNHIAYLQLTPTGITPVNAPEFAIAVFPNPATSSITVQLKNGEKILGTEILDITGRKVAGESTSATSQAISLTSFSAGMYTLRVLTNSGWGSTRLIKD